MDLAGLLDALAAGGGATEAVHPDLHKVGSSALVHIQNVADDGLTSHLLHRVVLVLLEHIENIKHGSIPFCLSRCALQRSAIIYPNHILFFK